MYSSPSYVYIQINVLHNTSYSCMVAVIVIYNHIDLLSPALSLSSMLYNVQHIVHIVFI